MDLVALVDKLQNDTAPGDIVTDKIVSLPKGIALHSLKPLLDAYRTRPELRQGTTRLTDLDSFIAWANRHKDEGSVVFAEDDMSAPKLVAIIDHDEAGPEALDQKARFGRHRGEYAFPLSREWKAWLKASETPMSAAEFAAFFEERIADVMPPPYEIDGHGTERFASEDPEIRKLVMMLGKRFAMPQDIVKLTRGININVDARAAVKVDLDTGERLVEFAETNGEGIDRVKPPNAFLIAIPVVAHSVPTLIAVHLRYRAVAGKIIWIVQLHQPERVFEHVFEKALEDVAEKTGLTPLRGTAPAAR
jgi:hypothetical protein